MMNIKSMLMLSVSCLTFMATKDVQANINSRESNLDTKHIYTHAHLVNKHLSSAYYSSPMAFNLRGVSIAPLGSNLSTSNFPQTTSLSSSPMAFNLRGASIAPSGSNLSTSGFPQTASVCFITDTNDCKGDEFDVAEEYPKYDPTPVDSCRYEGYLKTFCEPLYEPYNYCPYDENYWEKCVCKSEFKETCLPPYSGIGSACEGKYERCCKNDCPSGYDTSSGTCRQASSQKTECGNACYKILDNTCKSGSLNAPSGTGGYENKIVGYTDCGNPCWQSYDDNCPSGYVKDKSGGKCYETAITYTPFGSACYKEISCCDDTCSGYTTAPTNSQCPGGYNIGTTDCGSPCYSCRKCRTMPQICIYKNDDNTIRDNKTIVSQCSFLKFDENLCVKYFYPCADSRCGWNTSPANYSPQNLQNRYYADEWHVKSNCYKSVSNIYEFIASWTSNSCYFELTQDISPTTQECLNAAPSGAPNSVYFYENCQEIVTSGGIKMNGHSIRYLDISKCRTDYWEGVPGKLLQRGTLLYPETFADISEKTTNIQFEDIDLVIEQKGGTNEYKAIFTPNPKSVKNMSITCQDDPLKNNPYPKSFSYIFSKRDDAAVSVAGYLRVVNCGNLQLGNATLNSGASVCINGKNYSDGTSC